MSGETDTALEEKLETLNARLGEMGSVLVAFSAGVDSALLAAAARRRLGDKAVAVTLVSEIMPRHERESAAGLAERIGIRHRFAESHSLRNARLIANEPDRCYHCKSALITVLKRIAREEQVAFVIDGGHADDEGDYRPGRLACREQGVRSPLREAGLTKADVRALSRAWGLPTADKPSSACLASRIPYGRPIDAETLLAVDAAEDALRDMGFCQVRVRAHGDLARIELEPAEIARVKDVVLRESILREVKRAGFRYVALDLQGYRMGSLNEAI